MAGKPAQQTPAPAGKRLSLDEFAATQRPAPGAIERWFAQHPGVREEVEAGLKKHNVMVVWRWLKQVHSFPLTNNSVRSFKERLAR